MVILRESCLVYLGINYINVPPVQSLFFCDSNCWEISVSSSRCASFFILFFPSVLLATLRPEVSHKPWVTLFFALLPRAARAATRWRRRPLEARRGAARSRPVATGTGVALRPVGAAGPGLGAARCRRCPVPGCVPASCLCLWKEWWWHGEGPWARCQPRALLVPAACRPGSWKQTWLRLESPTSRQQAVRFVLGLFYSEPGLKQGVCP